MGSFEDGNAICQRAFGVALAGAKKSTFALDLFRENWTNDIGEEAVTKPIDYDATHAIELVDRYAATSIASRPPKINALLQESVVSWSQAQSFRHLPSLLQEPKALFGVSSGLAVSQNG
ncbi:hypothetical protein ml_118 [Mollivirus sibericum]|uniref:hypothetical protein n=1 Tax=Mollivirus sibericum TaxID=1678078 RepID=UPI0006B2DDA6|nr:hypothetical protein ml_118 [Mollivirus sibericum]ALD61920.1 hypothetical protein ml_118 [Mollivirus sibericum]